MEEVMLIGGMLMEKDWDRIYSVVSDLSRGRNLKEVDREDVVQEVMCSLFQSPSFLGIEDEEAEKAFIFSSVRNRVRNIRSQEVRDRKRHIDVFLYCDRKIDGVEEDEVSESYYDGLGYEHDFTSDDLFQFILNRVPERSIGDGEEVSVFVGMEEKRLKKTFRSVLILRYLGFNNREIADMFKVSEVYIGKVVKWIKDFVPVGE